MKLLVLILLAASIGQIAPQRDDFVEYLLSLQYICEPVYNFMVNFVADSRAELSRQLTELNDFSINAITTALHTVIDVRDRTDAAIADATAGGGNAECIAGATQEWPSLLELIGNTIADCAEEHVEPIQNQTEHFHLFTQEQNRVAFDIQNLIINVFTHLSPLITYDEITPTIEVEIDRVIDEFETRVRPEIEEILRTIQHFRDDIPEEIQICTDAGLEGFTGIADNIATTVAAC